ncbi:MAG TPA: LEA type 2 family protein [Thermoanaerobaculia bacterium]|nr:LEA type 2 family protein [Thermoanaerobaculia bacterium]
MESWKSPVLSRARRSAGMIAAGVVIVALAGARCSQLAGVFEKPELDFRAIRINAIGLEGATLEILVDVYNPNSYRLGLERLSYDLAIEDIPWGVGSTESPIAVEGRSNATLMLPLSVSWSRLGEAGREALRSGSVNYGVSGNMTVATSLGAVNVPYSRAGRFSVLSGSESSDPGSSRSDPTGRFRLATRPSRYSTETATPFSKTIFFPTLL